MFLRPTLLKTRNCFTSAGFNLELLGFECIFWTSLASLEVQYPALFGHFQPEFLSCVKLWCVPIMLTGSGSVLMAGLCITLGSIGGLWLVTRLLSWPLIGWWGHNIPGPDKCAIPPAYRLFNTSGNYFSSFNNNEWAPHQSLSKYAKTERYHLYCSMIRSIRDRVTGCWIESRCSLPL